MSFLRKFRNPTGTWHNLFLVLLALELVLFGCPNLHAATNVVAWGAGMTYNPADTNDYGQSIVPIDLTNATMVAGGWLHSLALRTDGSLEGWGDNTYGQISFVPTGANNYLAIACGLYHSLALKADGTVAANAGFGPADSNGQTDVPNTLGNVVAVACGFYHSLALKADGTVVAWGGTGFADYGQGTVPTGLSNVVAIAGGGWHSLVLKSDGTVFAWGRGDSGQTNIPPGLSNVVAIAAGGWHNLALKSDGTVVAWGAGTGSNSLIDCRQNLVPTNLADVVQVAAGKVHSLVTLGSGLPMTQAVLVQPNLGPFGFNVFLPTQNGRVYQLQYKNSLTNSTWQSLPLRPGTGGVLQFTDPTVVSQRFYRVLRW